jgi:hypothetical protein
VIDLTSEKALGLDEICKILPPSRGAKKTSFTTVLRWIQKGARAANGQVVRLEALRLGCKWISTREAVQRFALKLTEGATSDAPNATPRTPGRRQRAAEQAGQQLTSMGI